MKKFPFYPLLVALFPVLALYSANMGEVSLHDLLRPLLWSLGLGVIVFGLLMAIFRRWHRAALVSTLVLLLFYTYGHVYYLLRRVPTIGLDISRDRYLIPLYAILLGVGIWLIVVKIRKPARTCLTLNVFSILLTLIPVVSITVGLIRTTSLEHTTMSFSGYEQTIDPSRVTVEPDIYYIILDTYTRQDALLNDYGFDNSAFLDQLTDMGFYVATCARSNYFETQSSLATSLNMNYLPDVIQIAEQNHLSSSIYILIKESLVRAMLQQIGYKTVAFATTYAFTEITDADYYLSPSETGMLASYLTPFERLFLKTTAANIVSDLEAKNLFNSSGGPYNGNPFVYHIKTESYILEELHKMPQIEGPKFVFAHLVLTHGPYVFLPDGSVTNDPHFFGDELNPISVEYKHLGYLNQVQFSNDQILDIVSTIITNSPTPPVIIIQGDHGFEDQNRNDILDAYYVDTALRAQLYPTITPVNSFRLIFNFYFHTDFEQLPDRAYSRASPTTPVPETSPACLQYYP
jgi:hypothetical protein